MKNIFGEMIWSLILLLWLMAMQSVAGSPVKLEGVMSVNSFLNSGEINSFHSVTNDFSVVIGGRDSWLIEVKGASGQKGSMYLGTDGDDVYFANYLTTQSKDLDYEIKPGVGYISEGQFPFQPYGEHKRVNFLWLAFGSSDYIEHDTTGSMPLPWLTSRSTPLAFGFGYEVGTLAPGSSSVQLIQFKRRQELDLLLEEEMGRIELDVFDSKDVLGFRKRHVERRKMDWPEGSTIANFEVLEFAVIGDREFPVKFYLEIFNSSNRRVEKRYEGNITKLTPNVNLSSFKPPVIRQICVEDSRQRIRSFWRNINGINCSARPLKGWSDLSNTCYPDYNLILRILVIVAVVPLMFLLRKRKLKKN